MKVRSLVRFGRPATAILIVSIAQGCGDDAVAPEDRIPAVLSPVSVATQNGTVGEPAPNTPMVRVVDAENLPVPGVTVIFEPTQGSGGVLQEVVTTDAEGTASPGEWILGESTGTHTLRASVEDLGMVNFTAVAAAGPPDQVESLLNVIPAAAAGAGAQPPPGVRVLDRFGNAVAGVRVDFVVVSGGGSVTGTPVFTDGIGVARVTSWVLGTEPGPNELEARVEGAGSVVFTAIATSPDPPTSVVAVAGDGQVAGIDSPVPIPPAVRVTDADGVPVLGVHVTFTVIEGGGRVNGSASAIVPTNAQGEAALTSWILGPVPGTNRIEATVPGLPDVVFTAEGELGPPDAVLVVRGASQPGVTGTPTLIPPAFRVVDFRGTPVPNEPITFAVAAGGGTIETSVTTTDQAGLASPGEWVLGPTPGLNRVTATVAGLPPVEVSADAAVRGSFDIDLRFLTEMTASRRAIFEEAAARWAAVIASDLPEVSFAANPIPENACGVPHPEFGEVVDDLVIFVRIDPIDGAQGTLAQAAPCSIRTQGRLTIVGVMRIDESDANIQESGGGLADVVLHEMGHVLGFGTVWKDLGLLENPSTGLPGGSVDTRFTGALARQAFGLIGGTSSTGDVPVENTFGGAGTRDSHWRESVFTNEVMTGFLGTAIDQPLSLVSIAAMADIGYRVDPTTADPFILGPFAALRASAGDELDLGAHILDTPIFVVREDGMVVDTIR